jgi:hypothetical protein
MYYALVHDVTKLQGFETMFMHERARGTMMNLDVFENLIWMYSKTWECALCVKYCVAPTPAGCLAERSHSLVLDTFDLLAYGFQSHVCSIWELQRYRRPFNWVWASEVPTIAMRSSIVRLSH